MEDPELANFWDISLVGFITLYNKGKIVKLKPRMCMTSLRTAAIKN